MSGAVWLADLTLILGHGQAERQQTLQRGESPLRGTMTRISSAIAANFQSSVLSKLSQARDCSTRSKHVTEFARSVIPFHTLRFISLNALMNNTDSSRLIVYNLLACCFTEDRNSIRAGISASKK